MALRFNHTILPARDKRVSADFLADVLGAPPARPLGPFMAVALDGHASVDFVDHPEGELPSLHLALLVDDADFDHVMERLHALDLPYWGDPHGQLPQQVNTHDGGRGVYFRGPEGHAYEALTVPYGGW